MTNRLAGNADPKRREVYELADALLGGTLTRAQAGRLETLVSGDVEARRHYVRFMHDSALLNQWGRDAADTDQVAGTLRVPSLEQLFSVAADPAGDAAVQPPHQVAPDSPIFLSPLPPSLSTTHYPLSTNFVGGPVFSYIAATLILGVMLLGAWAYTITHDYGPSHAINSSFAKNSRGSTTPGLSTRQRPELIFVARVTGMKDCRWSDPATETYAGAYVPLGRKYALSSGLMEITYSSGAKVILEGPCRYEVESAAGGFLALGKLTARVKKNDELGIMNDESLMQRSDIHYSSFITHHLFSVRTPTAVVTDLGTEFGVEVKHGGETISHVFQGRVVVRIEGPGARGQGSEGINQKSKIRNHKSVVLAAGESVRVVRVGDRIEMVKESSQELPTGEFTRRMPKAVRIKLFNTGISLREGEQDPHWHITAVGDDPNFHPRPAVVSSVRPSTWLENDPARSQWISMSGDLPTLSNDVTYTFRTTFRLKRAKAVLWGWFIADNCVVAIRINGGPIPVPKHADAPRFELFSSFVIKEGFIDGVNTLEVDVRNGSTDPNDRAGPGPMLLRVELKGYEFIQTL